MIRVKAACMSPGTKPKCPNPLPGVGFRKNGATRSLSGVRLRDVNAPVRQSSRYRLRTLPGWEITSALKDKMLNLIGKYWVSFESIRNNSQRLEWRPEPMGLLLLPTTLLCLHFPTFHDPVLELASNTVLKAAVAMMRTPFQGGDAGASPTLRIRDQLCPNRGPARHRSWLDRSKRSPAAPVSARIERVRSIGFWNH